MFCRGIRTFIIRWIGVVLFITGVVRDLYICPFTKRGGRVPRPALRTLCRWLCLCQLQLVMSLSRSGHIDIIFCRGRDIRLVGLPNKTTPILVIGRIGVVLFGRPTSGMSRPRQKIMSLCPDRDKKSVHTRNDLRLPNVVVCSIGGARQVR